jgi:hypothetical protein
VPAGIGRHGGRPYVSFDQSFFYRSIRLFLKPAAALTPDT